MRVWRNSAALSPDGKRIVHLPASADKARCDLGRRERQADRRAAHRPRRRCGVRRSAPTASKSSPRFLPTRRIWDAESGKPTGEPLKGHDEAVNSASFTLTASKMSPRLGNSILGRRDPPKSLS